MRLHIGKDEGMTEQELSSQCSGLAIFAALDLAWYSGGEFPCRCRQRALDLTYAAHGCARQMDLIIHLHHRRSPFPHLRTGGSSPSQTMRTSRESRRKQYV